jgi:hypothetical protein
MRRVIRKTLIAIGIVCILTQFPNRQVHAQVIDGMRLHEYCGLTSQDASKLSNRDALHMNECIYFVDGVIQGYAMADGKPALCIPTDEGITNGQIGLVVFQYTDKHPERLHIPASTLVIEALLNGFHCKS